MGIFRQGSRISHLNKGDSDRPGMRPTSLADALFSSTQRRVLGLLFGHAERSFFATEIIKQVGAGSGAVQRELSKLSDKGLVRVTRIGNQKHYQADHESPIFNELCAIVRKTVGLADPIRAALKPAQDRITLAMIYGSVAKGTETGPSDVDLLLVSDSLTLEEIYTALAPAERAIGRTINPTLYTRKEFHQRRSSGNTFLTRVLAGDVMVLTGHIPDDSSRA